MRKCHFKTALCLAGVSALTVGVGSAGAATGDYQLTLKEVISSGAASESPMISLDTSFSSASGGAPVPTGSISFLIDTGHLAPGAWQAIQKAPAGTRLGTFTSGITGTAANEVRLQGVGNDALGPDVRATVGIGSSVAQEVGTSFAPATMRMINGGKQLQIQMNLQGIVGKLAALRANSTVESATFQLQGKIAYGGALHAITSNPSQTRALTNEAMAQACAQPACTTLRPVTPPATATVHLPKSVSLLAPDVLSYGYRYSIGGSGRPGDHVTLSALGADGSLLATPWSAYVRPDGSFEVRATVRSGFDSANQLVRPAAGRYAVSATEGNATVLAIAANDTHVRLVKPQFKVLRKDGGSKLHFVVRVPGADPNVKVRIELGKDTLVEGTTNAAGRFFATVPRPIRKGNLRVVASVPGADTAISNPIAFSTLS